MAYVVSIVCALLLSGRLLPVQDRIYRGFLEKMLDWFNGGEAMHGTVAWAVSLVMVLAPTIVLQWLMAKISPLAGWLTGVILLSLALDFPRKEDLPAEVPASPATDQPADSAAPRWQNEVDRLWQQASVRLIGPMVWMVIAGPVAAIASRCLAEMAGQWVRGGVFANCARRAHHLAAALPVRVLALCFAIAGNFERTFYGWRISRTDQDIVRLAGWGALGYGTDEDRSGTGPETLNAAFGLVWRALVVCLIMTLLLRGL